MKHFCVICWSSWFCGVAKRKKGEPKKPKCTGRRDTMCDDCLLNTTPQIVQRHKND